LRIPDARLDQRVQHNLAIPDLGVIAYLGVPITSDDGMILGSFCVIDGQVHSWTDEDLFALEDLGKALASEIRLRERTELLRHNLTAREDAERGREQMLHMLVHDMRTPAGIILSTLDLLDPPASNDLEQLELLEMAKKSAQDLLSMFNEMLEVHRMKEGKPLLQLAPTSINDLLRETFLEVHPLVDKRQQLLQVSYPSGAEIILPIDRRLLRRVLLNLATNASKYCPPEASIRLSAEAAQGGVRLGVEDNGPGISSDEKARLFASFSQGEGGLKHAGNSFGLGLAFCRLAVEAHGGTLWVEDSPGGGARFLAFIPSNCLLETPAAA
jgi:signal transduction histidine kinase